MECPPQPLGWDTWSPAGVPVFIGPGVPWRWGITGGSLCSSWALRLITLMPLVLGFLVLSVLSRQPLLLLSPTVVRNCPRHNALPDVEVGTTQNETFIPSAAINGCILSGTLQFLFMPLVPVKEEIPLDFCWIHSLLFLSMRHSC